MRVSQIATLIALPIFVATVEANEPQPVVSKAEKNEQGFLVHTVKSVYQAGTTEIRVLLPDRSKKGPRQRVLYLLPVEAKNGNRYGDGLAEAKKLNLHNRYGLVCVAPTFSHLPWYADHPTDKQIRQETYFLKAVVPFIDRTYPVRAEADGRLLAGFSKSGWGAFSLLLRNPDVFGRAAAWDAPLVMKQPNRFGMGPIFGSQENFEKYRIDSLMKRRAVLLRKKQRLVLTGYGNFRGHHQPISKLMTDLGIQHLYRDGPQRKHHWNGGWLDEAVGLLVAESE